MEEKRPTLSLCMIVKNEAKFLRRCLESAAPFVDEVIIDDTGSDDGTAEIAQEFATDFCATTWPDSFSAARNAVLERATGDYIVVLDGDEWIPANGAWAKIREMILQEDPDGIALRVHNNLPAEQLLQSDFIWQIRVFRNCKEYKYRGRVHNQLAYVIQENPKSGKLMQLDVVVEHDGYAHSIEELKQKYTRRIPLLEAELEQARVDGDRKWEEYYKYQLANGYFMIKEYAHTARLLGDVAWEFLTDENAFSAHIMGFHSNQTLEDNEKANWHASCMMDIWPWEPISMFMKGVSLMGFRRYESAKQYLMGVMFYVEQPQRAYKYNMDREYIAQALGDAHFQLREYAEAKKWYALHLTKYPGNTRVANLERSIVPVGQQGGIGNLSRMLEEKLEKRLAFK